MIELLANAAPAADPMISGNWILAMIGAITTAAAAFFGKAQGRKEAQRTTLESPVPEVPTRKVPTPPTYDAHRALEHRVGRVEEDITRIRDELKEDRRVAAMQFQQLMQAGQDRELRLGEKIEGFANAIHRRIDTVLKDAVDAAPRQPNHKTTR